MATKRGRTSGKKVKSLGAKGLTGKRAKGVKGGITVGSITVRQADGSVKQLEDPALKQFKI